MLLRSSSTPLPNSGISKNCKDFFPEPESILKVIPRSRSHSAISLSSSKDDCSFKKTPRALPETDLRETKKPLLESTSMHALLSGIAVDEEENEKQTDEVGRSDRLLFLSQYPGLNLEERHEAALESQSLTEVMMGGGGRGCGGRISCRGGGDENEDGSENGDSDHRHGSIDVYYKKMIKANPGNPLLLSNYARYLKEVRADLEKAEEYCGRAVMTTPDDGNILSLYAELIWQKNKDPVLAENYFDQAVQAAPKDCYVLASYAKFLWDAEEEMTEADYASQPPPAVAAS